MPSVLTSGWSGIFNLPVSEWDVCMSPPLRSSRRHSDSACGTPNVMAVDEGLQGEREVFFFFKSRSLDDGPQLTFKLLSFLNNVKRVKPPPC